MTLYALVCVCVCVQLYMYIFVCVCVCVCVMLQAESKAGRIVSVVPVKSSHIQSISSCLIQLMLLLRSSFVLLPPIQCKSPIKLSIQFRMGSILVIAKQSTGLGLIILVLPPSILSSPPPTTTTTLLAHLECCWIVPPNPAVRIDPTGWMETINSTQ